MIFGIRKFVTLLFIDETIVRSSY